MWLYDPLAGVFVQAKYWATEKLPSDSTHTFLPCTVTRPLHYCFYTVEPQLSGLLVNQTTEMTALLE